MTREEAIQDLKDILEEATLDEDAVCYVTSEDAKALNMAIEALQNLSKPNNGLQGSDLISRQDAIETILGEPMNEARYPSWYASKIKTLPSAEVVSDIRKLQDILLMKIDSFEGTRNIVEKGMLEAWKDVVEYIDGVLEGGDDE